MQCRRRRSQQVVIFLWMADHLVYHLEEWLPIRRDRFHEREEIRDSDIINSASIKIGSECHSCKRAVASIASAVDRYSFWIGNAFALKPFHTIGYIVLHRLSPLLE